MGMLISRDAVEKNLGKAIKIACNKLLAVPTRVAPKVTVESNQRKNFALLTKEMENVIHEIQQAMDGI